MMFANTDKEITLIYHAEERIGKQILAYAKTEKIPIHDIDLTQVVLSPSHWAEIAAKLKLPVSDLINMESPEFQSKFGKANNLSENDWLTLLVNNPTMLKAPVVMKGARAVLMTNPQDMLHFVT